MTESSERAVAVRSVLEACRLCAEVQRALVSEETLAKKDSSPVTVADYGAQALVHMELTREFPDDPIVAEEEATSLREEANASLRARVVEHVRALRPEASEEAILDAIDRGGHPGGPSGRFWTLDPIDGTKGFLRGEQYAVALALLQDGKIVLGVLGCPNLPFDASCPDGPRGCLFIAERGKGAVMRSLEDPAERPVRVSGVSDPARAAFCESVESGHSKQDDAARVAALLGVQAPPIRMDSQAKYAAVARGDAGIYLRLPTRAGYEERIWDHGAGWLVITEAGGAVTDVDGEPLDFSAGRTLKHNRGVVATNGVLHEQAIAAVREVLGT